MVFYSQGFYRFRTQRMMLRQPICSPVASGHGRSHFESNGALRNWSDPLLNNGEMTHEPAVPLGGHSEGITTRSGLRRDHSQVQNENIGTTFTSGVLTNSQPESLPIGNSFFNNTEALNKNNGMIENTGGVLMNSQTKQFPLNQFETFEAPHGTRSGGCRVTLTDDQRKENKKKSDRTYRDKKKKAEADLLKKNKSLQELLTRALAEIQRLQDEILITPHDLQILAGILQGHGQDTYIAQSTSEQLDHPSVSVQVSGLEMNDFQNLLQTIPINAVATDNDVTENQMNSRTGTCYDNTTIEHLIKEIDEDVTSNVRSSDFTGLDGERIKIGKYNFPPSLRPVVERIDACYGDVSATCKVNLESVEATYVLFCASLREMDDLRLEGVSKDRILKWRDAIKDALRMGLKVDFAMDHLKKIAHAYIGRIKSQELMNMTEGISKLEADLNSRKEELAKRKELSKKDMDAAEEFNGKSLSLFT